MIDTTIYQKHSKPFGFEMSGHADFDEYGQDIVCAAVSALVLNTINSVEDFTEDKFEFDSDEKSGYIRFIIKESISPESDLLLKSLLLGLKGISSQYGKKYLKVAVREV